jgi:hypothetical protein
MMALSGVRSSWLMLETKCDLCSLAVAGGGLPKDEPYASHSITSSARAMNEAGTMPAAPSLR